MGFSRGADAVLTEFRDTIRDMKNKPTSKEKRTRLELLIGLAVVAFLYLFNLFVR